MTFFKGGNSRVKICKIRSESSKKFQGFGRNISEAFVLLGKGLKVLMKFHLKLAKIYLRSFELKLEV